DHDAPAERTSRRDPRRTVDGAFSRSTETSASLLAGARLARARPVTCAASAQRAHRNGRNSLPGTVRPRHGAGYSGRMRFRVTGRHDPLLLGGLAFALLVVFQRSVQFLYQVAHDVERTYGVALI